MRIFISWSKNKSKQLAELTKQFICDTLDNNIDIFFSPKMYKGTCVDFEIHQNLLNCDKCIVCITADNFKNPWLMYESGVVYGSNYSTNKKSGIVIPILFEYIPDWSSWVDKPLNRYVPISIQSTNNDFNNSKIEFQRFFNELAEESNSKIKNFNRNWNSYINAVQEILQKEQQIPDNCKDLFYQLIKAKNDKFTMESPEISFNHILFHKGYSTNALTEILTNSIMLYQGKRLWIYGRRNRRLLDSDSYEFFKYLTDEGLENGVDFRCLLPNPNSTYAMDKIVNKVKQAEFPFDLRKSLRNALLLKRQYNLPVEKLFRLYSCKREFSITISDSVILYHSMPRDGEGYPLPMTDTSFKMYSLPPQGKEPKSPSEKKAKSLLNVYENIWNKSEPLTEEIFYKFYNEKI